LRRRREHRRDDRRKGRVDVLLRTAT
jgi:hypothetical protein